MSRKTWDNTSTKPGKGDTTYGLNNNKTAVSFMRTHQLHPTPQSPKRQVLIYFTFSTFDCEFIILQDEHAPGKFHNNHLSMRQKLKMQTQYPIANCFLQNRYNTTANRDELIGYLVDIFSNVYTVNFTVYIDYNTKFNSLQPIAYLKIYQNIPKNLNKTAIYEQYPLLFHKHQNYITLFNIAGQFKLLDLSQTHSKSWINNCVKPEFDYSFGAKGLAACSNNAKSNLGSVVVISVKNNQTPYVFINLECLKQLQHDRKCMDKEFTQWELPIKQVTFCSFDATTNLLAVSLISLQVQLYEIKRSTQTGQIFHYCQKVLKFEPVGQSTDPLRYIEYLSTSKGYLAITFYDEYVLMDLKSRVVKKRGKGNKDKNKVEKLKWTHIIDRDNDHLAVVLTKGYNHINSQQSRLGKPNLHFKTMDLNKDQRDR